MPETSIVFAPAGTATSPRRPDRLDAVALDDDDAVLDDLVALHRDDAPAGERDAFDAGGTSIGAAKAMFTPCAGGSGSFSGAPGRNANASFRSRWKSSGPERPVEARGVAGQVQVLARVLRDARDGNGLALRPDVDAAARLDERRDVRVEALAEGEPLAVGRDRELLRELGEVVLVLVGAVELDRGEDALRRRDLVAAALGLDEEDAVGRPRRTAGCAPLQRDERGLVRRPRRRPSRGRAPRTTRGERR